MSRHVIVLGDKTSHKGTVISAAPADNTHGKGLARIGDKVSCPLCGGIFPISEGDASVIVDGKPVAYDGCKVSCGATLIASQIFTSTEPSAGTAPGAAGAVVDAAAQELAAQGFGAIGSGLIAGYQEVPLDEEHKRFKGRFRVLDANTYEPVAALSARVRSTAGQSLGADIDAEGYTAWVERDAAEALAFDLTQQDPA